MRNDTPSSSSTCSRRSRMNCTAAVLTWATSSALPLRPTAFIWSALARQVGVSNIMVTFSGLTSRMRWTYSCTHARTGASEPPFRQWAMYEDRHQPPMPDKSVQAKRRPGGRLRERKKSTGRTGIRFLQTGGSIHTVSTSFRTGRHDSQRTASKAQKFGSSSALRKMSCVSRPPSVTMVCSRDSTDGRSAVKLGLGTGLMILEGEYQACDTRAWQDLRGD
mmetsp:Transcript_7743/g.22045  ORF Transcript_7743/g.22045 Transcript_7743/m.22045 type:complete len:220 (+) Transcript_7743:837-1496(+)